MFYKNHPNEILDLETFKFLTKVKITLRSEFICTHHGYPSTLFHSQLHQVQLSLVAHRSNLRRYEPSLVDIIGQYSTPKHLRHTIVVVPQIVARLAG